VSQHRDWHKVSQLVKGSPLRQTHYDRTVKERFVKEDGTVVITDVLVRTEEETARLEALVRTLSH